MVAFVRLGWASGSQSYFVSSLHKTCCLAVHHALASLLVDTYHLKAKAYVKSFLDKNGKESLEVIRYRSSMAQTKLSSHLRVHRYHIQRQKEIFQKLPFTTIFTLAPYGALMVRK